jgi:hypothetical protein
MGLMNARRMTLVALASLSSLAAATLFAAPAALAEEACPNAASRQGPSGALPDCRAYEQVTPTNKGDAQDLFPSREEEASVEPETAYVAEDGDHVLLNGGSPLESGDAYLSSFVFSRGSSGWTTTSLSPGLGVHRVLAEVFNTADLSEVGVHDNLIEAIPGQPERQAGVNYAGALGGPFATISSDTTSYSTVFAGASADLSHIVLSSNDHELAPGATAQVGTTNALYEWFKGQLRR